MDQACALADQLQREADRVLDASPRWPALREFAFLYRERYGADAVPPKTQRATEPRPNIRWFLHDVHGLFQTLSAARSRLPVVPMDHLSIWWRLASESGISSRRTGGLHGYSVKPQFDDTGFQLALSEVFGSTGIVEGTLSSPQCTSGTP
jgi:hypothetical protein